MRKYPYDVLQFSKMSLPLSEFFFVSTDSLCVIDKSGKILETSPSMATMLGFTETELDGKSIQELIVSDEEGAFPTIIHALETERRVSFENRMVAKDGTNKWVSWVASKAEDPAYLLLVGKDVTNEKKTQTELRSQNRRIEEAKARNEAVLASIGDGVVVVSDKGEVIFINKSALNILNTTVENVLGKHLIRAISATDEEGNPLAAENHPMQESLMRGRKITSRDICFLKSDGKKFPVSATAAPVSLQGVLIGGVLVFRDITHEKEVDRMKTEFISLASHQLRTPLSAMKWFSEMLISGDAGQLTPDQLEMVQNIYKSNERMVDLVNSLLNISRIESGRIIIDPRPTDLKQLLDEVLLELTPKIQKKNHHVAVSIHSNLPPINIDPKLIRHVYMNLLTNSIKYTPDNGEINVMISHSGDELISQVSDNGYGIPQEEQGKVFNKFFRAENIVKVETDGTGLGLYLLKSIVEASGGKIWFESEVGKGTTFWFSLPMNGSTAKEGEVTISS
jgi:PAS domain S-box-containing protein